MKPGAIHFLGYLLLVLAVGTYLWSRKYGIVARSGAVTVTNIVVLSTNTVWVYRTNWAELPDLYFHVVPLAVLDTNGQVHTLFIPVVAGRSNQTSIDKL